MKAVFVKCNENAKTLSSAATKSIIVVAVKDKKIKTPITAKIWRTGASVRCSIWVSTADGRHTTGYGRAGGGGYHRNSAALDAAIISAGIELYGNPYAGGYSYGQMMADERATFDAMTEAAQKAYLAKVNRRFLQQRAHISGRGDAAMLAALEAIAKAAGYRNFSAIEA